MSQRDSASRPLSRASSLSPRTVPPTSAAIPSTVPTIPSVRDELSLKLGREISEVSRAANSGESTSQVPRALGVHTILNPPDALSRGNVASIPPLSSASSSAEHLSAQRGHGGAASSGNIQSQQPYAFYGYPQVSGTPPSASPQTERSLPAFSGLDRGSPKTATPLPALNNPRAMMSPRMPRVQSLHNPPGHKQNESIESPVPPSTIGIKRSYEDSLGPVVGGPPSRQPLSYTAGPPPPSIMLPSAPPGIQGGPLRSASQPVLSEHRTPTSQHSIPVQSYQSEGAPSNISQLQQHPGQTTAAWDLRPGLGQPPVFGSGPLQTQDAVSWSAGGSAVSSVGAGRGRTRARNDRAEAPPQQYLEINPPGGERYIVAVDTQIASKQADEKRQRNAGASARFRQRRKQQALEDKNKIMQLEEDKRGLEARLLEKIHLVEYYRNERNRLRDIVLRTPGISESAHAGPRTPPSSALTLSGFPDQAQMPRAPPPPPGNMPPSHGYASSETSSIERPTRRRRTDQTPDSGPLSYVPQPQPHSLPSISGPPYGMPPSRPPSASSSGEILPPIRGIEATAAHEPGVPPPPGPSAPYYSLNRLPYESGWAHRQGGPSEGGQR